MLLVHAGNDPTARYSHYLRELLALEGFSGIQEIGVDHLGEALARDPDGLVLPRIQLPNALAHDVAAWVACGGRLVALHPDACLLRELGMSPGHLTVRDGVLTARNAGILDGLPLDPVQVIVPVATWHATRETRADVLATIDPPADPYTHTPAIWHLHLGKGEAVLFAFDLAASVARLRHGDPAMADMPNMIYDHINRPSDLFRDQIDARQAHVPQADVLCALLGRAVETLIPQPRCWYYPRADQRSVFLQTSDDDWSTIEQFETMIGVLKQYDAACTFYVVDRSQLTRHHMDTWEQEGHTFSVHPATSIDVEGGPPTLEAHRHWVPQMVRDNVARHREQYGRPVITIRNHAIRWVGYMDLAYLHAELGIRGEANYFALSTVLSGYLTGSGRLARFVDVDGTVIDHLQIASHWTEEILVSDTHGFSQRWLYSRAQDFTNGIIRNAATRYYTPTVVNSHPVSFATYSRPLIESNWRTARECGTPIITAETWVAFTDARREAELALVVGGYEVHAPLALPRLTVLFPEGSVCDAAGATVSRQEIWGHGYDAVELTNLTAGERRTIATTA